MFWRSAYSKILAANEEAAHEQGWFWSTHEGGDGFSTGNKEANWWIWHNRAKGSGITAPCGSLELWVKCSRRSSFVFASETMRTWIESQNPMRWGAYWLDNLTPCKYNIIGLTKTEPTDEIRCQGQPCWIWSRAELNKEHLSAVAKLVDWPPGSEKIARLFGFSGSGGLFAIQISAENPSPGLVRHLESTGRGLASIVTNTILVA